MYKEQAGVLQGRIWNPVRQCKAGSQALARAKLELSEITLICAQQGHRLSPPVPGPLLFESVARYCEKLYDIEAWRGTSAEEKRLCVNAALTLVSLADGSIPAGTEARMGMHHLLCNLFGTANVNQVPATYADFDILGGSFSGICKLKCSTKGGLTVVVQEAALLSTQFAAPKGMLAASPLLVVAGGNVALGALIKLPVDEAHFTAAETYKEVYCLSENRSNILESLACGLHAMRIFALACPKRIPVLWSDLSPWLARLCPKCPIERLYVGCDPYIRHVRLLSLDGYHLPDGVCSCAASIESSVNNHLGVMTLQFDRQIHMDYDDLGASDLVFDALVVGSKSSKLTQGESVVVKFNRRFPCAVAAGGLAEIGAVEELVGYDKTGGYCVTVQRRGLNPRIPLTHAELSDPERDMVVDRLREFEMEMTERGLIHGDISPETVCISRRDESSGGGEEENLDVTLLDLGYCAFDAGKCHYPLNLRKVTGDRREPYGQITLGDDNICFQRTIDWIYTYD